MKRVAFISMVFVMTCVNAADVKWDCFTQVDYGVFKNQIYYHFEYSGFQDAGVPSFIMPSIDVIVTASNGKVILKGSSESFYPEFIGVWIEKFYGDVLSYSAMVGHADYFAAINSYAVSGVTYSKPIELTSDSIIYLAVMQDSGRNNMENPVGKYFGWIELHVEVSGDVTLVHSAFAVDGSDLICGFYGDSIPEPVSGLLLLFGAGLLMLRRQHPLVSDRLPTKRFKGSQKYDKICA